MKFKDILKIGANIVGTSNPIVAGGIALVNSFLPDDRKLPVGASQADVVNAANGLSPEARASVWEKEIDLEIKGLETHAEIQETLAKADMAGSSTRPFIAKLMAWVITLTVLPVAWAYAYSVIANQTDLMTAISENWMVLVAIIGTPTWVVKAYFGLRSQDKIARYKVSHGQPVNSDVGIAAALVNAIRK